MAPARWQAAERLTTQAGEVGDGTYTLPDGLDSASYTPTDGVLIYQPVAADVDTSGHLYRRVHIPVGRQAGDRSGIRLSRNRHQSLPSDDRDTSSPQNPRRIRMSTIRAEQADREYTMHPFQQGASRRIRGRGNLPALAAMTSAEEPPAELLPPAEEPPAEDPPSEEEPPSGRCSCRGARQAEEPSRVSPTPSRSHRSRPRTRSGPGPRPCPAACHAKPARDE